MLGRTRGAWGRARAKARTGKLAYAWACAWLLGCVGVCLIAGAGHAEEGSEEDETVEPAPAGLLAGISEETARTILELTQRAEQLVQRGAQGDAVMAPLAESKLALVRMRDAFIQGDRQGAERAEVIARASLALAERRHSLALERALTAAALSRRDATRVRVEVSRVAREAEQKRLRELQLPLAPVAPTPINDAGVAP